MGIWTPIRDKEGRQFTRPLSDRQEGLVKKVSAALVLTGVLGMASFDYTTNPFEGTMEASDRYQSIADGYITAYDSRDED